MSPDSFYTPKILADRLLSYIGTRKLTNVVDFCIGDGQLLRAAQARWPAIKCFGSDISKDAISATRKAHDDWNIWQMDFLDQRKRIRAKALREQGKFDLILMNPPFTCKGGTNHTVKFGQEDYTVSTAMVFLVTALEYLSPNGILYAILPSSLAYAERDLQMFSLLEEQFNLSILEEPTGQFFAGCEPNVILVSLNDKLRSNSYREPLRIPINLDGVSVSRGKLSMDKIETNSGKYPLVHTVNLQNNKLANLTIKQAKAEHAISGPALLLPRVGKPNPTKVCIISSSQTIILSDCIIAIKTLTIQDAKLLSNWIIDNWILFQKIYTGTGAKYTTIRKIEQFLNLDGRLHMNNAQAI